MLDSYITLQYKSVDSLFCFFRLSEVYFLTSKAQNTLPGS